MNSSHHLTCKNIVDFHKNISFYGKVSVCMINYMRNANAMSVTGELSLSYARPAADG